MSFFVIVPCSILKTYFSYSTVTEKYSFNKKVYIDNELEVTSGMKLSGNSTFYDYVTFQDSGAIFVDGATLQIDYLYEIVDSDGNPIVICEHLNDSNGNARFVEGNLTTKTVTGVTFTYAKWSLSGSHLMLVLCGEVAANATLGYGAWGEVELPDYIINKISNVFSSYIAVNEYKAYHDDWTSIDVSLAYQKIGNKIYFTQVDSANNTNADAHFRIQFDLLIDMA